MSDTPPHSTPPSADVGPTVAPVPPHDGVLPAGGNGASYRPIVTTHIAPPRSTGADLLHWLAAKAMYLGVLLALWVVALLALKLGGCRPSSAIGFATVITALAAFFVRSFLPMSSEKAVAAAQMPATPPDSFREVVETVVFVVVLVLLLKSFAAEAFVIPTGSMAQTLYGYQKLVTCPECGHEFPVNCSSEVDPSDGPPSVVRGCTCPNCRQKINFIWPDQETPQPAGVDLIPNPGWNSGDRVLVAKFVYDLLNKLPDRLDVVVFKFPGGSDFPAQSGPVKKHVPMNYIKRLTGLPGETIGIYQGKLYVLSAAKGPHYDDYEKAGGNPDKLSQLWRYDFMHHKTRADADSPEIKAFMDGEYTIVRKKPDSILSMMRLVYDNDHQARNLGPDFQRWLPADKSGWSANGPTAFQSSGAGPDGKMGWLRYRHILRGDNTKPQLITDFMAYNTGEFDRHYGPPNENWASDLIVECDVKVEKAQGVFALELSRGPDRFQAQFDLAEGTCTLFRLVEGKPPVKLDSTTKGIKGKGSYEVRFANVDDRLCVWVDEKLIFGDGVLYKMPSVNVKPLAPVKENDLDRPVSVGSKGASVVVGKLRVFRDTYYTTCRDNLPNKADVEAFHADDPETYRHIADAPISTYYVQPDHFLCMGDNSPESSDGRSWGLVPKRLLLGRALLVYYPFARAGRIR